MVCDTIINYILILSHYKTDQVRTYTSRARESQKGELI